MPPKNHALNCNCSKLLLTLKKSWHLQIQRAWLRLKKVATPPKKIEVKLIWIQPDYTPFHGCFLCGCIYILSGCHILIENSAIFITKCNEFSGRYLIAIFEKKQEKFSKQQKCYTTSLRILSHKRISFFQKLISTSVSNTKTQLFIETEIEMTKEKKFFAQKSWFSYLSLPPFWQKKIVKLNGY